MNTAIAISALAALFVAFGLVYRHRRCGSCDKPDAGCGSCPKDTDSRESPHV